MGKSEAPKLPLPPSGGVGLHGSPALSLACRQRRCWCATSNVTMDEVHVLSVGTLGTLPSRRFEQASLLLLPLSPRLLLWWRPSDSAWCTFRPTPTPPRCIFQEFHPPNVLSCRVN